ncbi:MAG TPA: cytochrome c [Pseudomonadota bacterium]|nr:cytochrome c [Pseudomonadota bacterium]
MVHSRIKKILAGIGTLGLAAALLFLTLYSGVISVAGTDQHTPPVRWLLKTTMERSVRAHARQVQIPAGINLRDRELAQRGYGHYQVACTPCHGAPGQGPAPWMVINPQAPLLVETADKWSDAELFYITKHGIKMTGMPALGPTHKDEHLWAISALVRQLPSMSAADYQAMGTRHAAATHPSTTQAQGAHASHSGM